MAANIKVNVKWGKEKFENVEVDLAESPEVFKAQLFALSGVPPERQKVMVKGTSLKDDTWSNFKIKEGITLLMMGSSDALPQAPVKKTVFMEDMTDSQVASALQLPAGLTNLGNTCYMNATVQCLKNVDELKEALVGYQGQLSLGSVLANPSEAVTVALRDLYKSMERAGDSMPPVIFLQVMHTVFPQFAEKNEQGVFQQQDANECWTQVVRMLQQRLPPSKSLTTEEQSEAAAKETLSFIDQYFGIEYVSKLKCDEAPEEPETVSTEKVYQISCFISQDVKYMHTGLQSKLKETITKNSPSLQRDASYTKTSLIDRLPGYLTIQFVRFFYKEKEKVNAKILKDVKYPMTLDVYDLCTPELQKKLEPIREKFKEQEDKNVEKARQNKSKENGEKMEVDQKETDKNTKTLPFQFDDDIGSNNSGYYELTAVLTHRGRSSSSGHYVSWVRRKGDDWVMCDDDKVSMVTSQDILKLSGGGDWHCAYVLLYGPKRLEVEEDE